MHITPPGGPPRALSRQRSRARFSTAPGSPGILAPPPGMSIAAEGLESPPLGAMEAAQFPLQPPQAPPGMAATVGSTALGVAPTVTVSAPPLPVVPEDRAPTPDTGRGSATGQPPAPAERASTVTGASAVPQPAASAASTVAQRTVLVVSATDIMRGNSRAHAYTDNHAGALALAHTRMGLYEGDLTANAVSPTRGSTGAATVGAHARPHIDFDVYRKRAMAHVVGHTGSGMRSLSNQVAHASSKGTGDAHAPIILTAAVVRPPVPTTPPVASATELATAQPAVASPAVADDVVTDTQASTVASAAEAAVADAAANGGAASATSSVAATTVTAAIPAVPGSKVIVLSASHARLASRSLSPMRTGGRMYEAASSAARVATTTHASGTARAASWMEAISAVAAGGGAVAGLDQQALIAAILAHTQGAGAPGASAIVHTPSNVRWAVPSAPLVAQAPSQPRVPQRMALLQAQTMAAPALVDASTSQALSPTAATAAPAVASPAPVVAAAPAGAALAVPSALNSFHAADAALTPPKPHSISIRISRPSVRVKRSPRGKRSQSVSDAGRHLEEAAPQDESTSSPAMVAAPVPEAVVEALPGARRGSTDGFGVSTSAYTAAPTQSHSAPWPRHENMHDPYYSAPIAGARPARVNFATDADAYYYAPAGASDGDYMRGHPEAAPSVPSANRLSFALAGAAPDRAASRGHALAQAQAVMRVRARDPVYDAPAYSRGRELSPYAQASVNARGRDTQPSTGRENGAWSRHIGRVRSGYDVSHSPTRSEVLATARAYPYREGDAAYGRGGTSAPPEAQAHVQTLDNEAASLLARSNAILQVLEKRAAAAPAPHVVTEYKAPAPALPAAQVSAPVPAAPPVAHPIASVYAKRASMHPGTVRVPSPAHAGPSSSPMSDTASGSGAAAPSSVLTRDRAASRASTVGSSASASAAALQMMRNVSPAPPGSNTGAPKAPPPPPPGRMTGYQLVTLQYPDGTHAQAYMPAAATSPGALMRAASPQAVSPVSPAVHFASPSANGRGAASAALAAASVNSSPTNNATSVPSYLQNTEASMQRLVEAEAAALARETAALIHETAMATHQAVPGRVEAPAHASSSMLRAARAAVKPSEAVRTESRRRATHAGHVQVSAMQAAAAGAHATGSVRAAPVQQAARVDTAADEQARVLARLTSLLPSLSTSPGTTAKIHAVLDGMRAGHAQHVGSDVAAALAAAAAAPPPPPPTDARPAHATRASVMMPTAAAPARRR